MTRTATLTAAATAVIAAVLAAGCTGEPEEVDADGLRAGYLHHLELAYELDLVTTRLYHACMESRGWAEHDYLPPAKQDAYNGFAGFNPRPEPDAAREVGYSRSYMFGREPELVNGPDWEHEDTIAYWDDLGGEGFGDLVFGFDPDADADGESDPDAMFERKYPMGGCIGEVIVELYGSHDAVKDHLALRYAATGDEPLLRAMADERVVSVERTWSACMADAGYAFDTPIEAELHAFAFRIGSSVNGEFYNTEISEAEADQAFADARCNVEVGLDETRFAVLWEYTDEFVARYETDYFAYRDATEGLIERATELLAEGRW